MKRIALCAAALSLAVPGTAHARTLVQVKRGGGFMADPFLLRAGAADVGSPLGIWLTDRATARTLSRAGLVVRSEPDRPMQSLDHLSQGDPLIPLEYWIPATGADRVEPPGPGKPITVIDSGVDPSHPEFAGRPNTTLLTPQTVVGKEEFHGTAVASLVAAPSNGIDLVGVYPQANLFLYDASPNGSLFTSDVVRGILAAVAQGPGVINLSLGSTTRSPLLESAVLYAYDRDVIVVAASGNDGDHGSPRAYPAELPHVLTVAATDEQNQPTFFSSRGLGVDIAAPGLHIPAAEPLATRPAGFAIVSGTSFSSPIVAGATAWVWTVRPELDKTQIAEVMRESATDILPAGFDEATGFGLVNIPQALAMAAPPSDPQEPNDDVELVRPNGDFRNGVPPLTDPGRRTGRIVAYLDVSEDPRDVYRVFVPARSEVTVTAKANGNVNLDLFGAATDTVTETGAARSRDLRATSHHPGKAPEAGTVANRGKAGFYAYAEVSIGADAGSAGYTLTVKTGALPKPKSR